MMQYLKQLRNFSNPIISIMICIIIAISLTMIDYFDLLSKCIVLFQKPYFIALFVAIAVVIVLCVFYVNPLSQLKSKSITSIDIFLYRLELSFILYLVVSLVLCGYNWIKTGVLVGFILCIGLFIFYRIILFIRSLKVLSNSENRILDLKKVYENDLPINDGNPIFINEKDVSYDLLDRLPIINKLVSSIQNHNTEGSFVIGLNGRWGSGKTTIINNAKKIIKNTRKDIIIIDEFDPWLYENQDSLLVAMFETIMKETGIKYSLSNLKRVCKIIKQIIGLSKNGETASKIFSIMSSKDEDYVTSLKEKINNFLSLNRKFVVVIVDNIERATADNVIFLFKLIGTLFDLKRITYVLSYDKERLNKIFDDTKKIDFHYIEKIIQQEIAVPIISKNKCNRLFYTCFSNMLKYYNVKQSDIPKYKFVCDYIANEIDDLRTFKRLINSTFATVFTEDSYLYKPDLLALETIRFCDSELYYAIHNNRGFFISSDLLVGDSTLYVEHILDTFNNKGKMFFAELFANKSQGIKDLLSSVFPYVKGYFTNGELNKNNMWMDSQYPLIQRDGRACSAKFFDLYFCYGANEYLFIKEDVKKFIEICNKELDLTRLLEERFMKINYDLQEEWLSMFQFHLTEVQDNKLLEIIKFLIIHLDNLDGSLTFFSANAVQRLIYITMKVLKLCSEDAFKNYLQFFDKRYNRLRFLDNVCHYLSNEMEADMFKERIQQLNDIKEMMCEQIISNDINLYIDENYRVKNIFSIYDYLKKSEDKSSFQDYISSIINENTIIRMLGDIIVESTSGTQYSYYVSNEVYNIFFGDRNIFDRVEAANIETESQQFIKDVYLYYLNGETNHFGEKALSYDYPIRFGL